MSDYPEHDKLAKVKYELRRSGDYPTLYCDGKPVAIFDALEELVALANRGWELEPCKQCLGVGHTVRVSRGELVSLANESIELRHAFDELMLVLSKSKDERIQNAMVLQMKKIKERN